MVRRFLWIAACLAFLTGLCALAALRSYHVLTREELVAVVRCEAAPKGVSATYLLLVAPVTNGVSGTPMAFSMTGDQWTLGGDILKWHPWVNLFGVRTCHKLTRLSSRYLKLEMEKKAPRSAYELNGGSDLFWGCLYRWGRRIPFVEAVYGSASYCMAEPGTRWGVYVTLSGYLLKPLPA